MRYKKKRSPAIPIISIALILISITIGIVSYNQNQYAPDTLFNESNTSQLDTYQEATLVRVIDGDTIVVNIDNIEYTVRLIGIDTPESVAPDVYLEATDKKNTKEGLLASEYTKNVLSNYTTVYLMKDTSDTDKYDRLLRYVWLEIPDEINIDTIRSKMLNGILLDNHIANIATYKPDTLYEDVFQSIYDTATFSNFNY